MKYKCPVCRDPNPQFLFLPNYTTSSYEEVPGPLILCANCTSVIVTAEVASRFYRLMPTEYSPEIHERVTNIQAYTDLGGAPPNWWCS